MDNSSVFLKKVSTDYAKILQIIKIILGSDGKETIPSLQQWTVVSGRYMFITEIK